MIGLKKILITAVICVFITASSLWADDVTDSLNDALNKYKNGEYTEAINSLNYAEQLITQKKGEALTDVFPEPMNGWEAGEVESNAVYGGGISAERRYSKDDSSIKISLVSDSPMIQGLMMMLTNPMFATSGGGKLETISGQKAIVNYSPQEKGGEIQMVVNNRFLITTEGNEVTKDDMTSYLSKMDFNKLSSLN